MPSPDALAAALARAHHEPVDGLPDHPQLAEYAESSRLGDWSLRSALVRFAQPEPTRAGAVLELVRRTDGALKPHRRRLESTAVPTLPTLDASAFIDEDGSVSVAGEGFVVDARAADLARVSARLADGDAVVAAYARTEDVSQDELAAVPLLVVALQLDALGDALAAWADAHDRPPPVDLVDEVAASAFRQLGSLGVPRETAPPRGRTRG